MMKTTLTTIFCTVVIFATNAQVKLTDRFGNLKPVQTGVEPWNVESSSTPASANTQNIYQNGSIGINTGTTTIDAALDILNNTGNTNTAQTSTSKDDIRITTYSGTISSTDYRPQLMLRRAAGTLAAPTNLSNGNTIGGIHFMPYFGSNFQSSGSAALVADYVGDGTNDKTALKFSTSSKQRMRIDEQGRMLLYGADANDTQNATATENLDVVGNARIRAMPDGSDFTNFPKMVLAKTDGTLGTANISSAGITADDNANTLFVIKRYTLRDNPTAADGGVGFNTDMSTAKWEAIMSNVQYKISTSSGDPFPANSSFGYRLKAIAGGTWRIIGDIVGKFEGDSLIDVLFVRKAIVAAENRTN